MRCSGPVTSLPGWWKGCPKPSQARIGLVGGGTSRIAAAPNPAPKLLIVRELMEAAGMDSFTELGNSVGLIP